MLPTLIKQRLLSNKTNTFVVISAFLICFFCIHTFLIVYSNLKDGFTNHINLNDVIIGSANSDKRFIEHGLLLKNGSITPLNNDKIIASSIKYQSPIYLGESYKGFDVIATDSNFFNIISQKTLNKNIKLEDRGVLLGYEVAQKLNYKIKQEIHLHNPHHHHTHHDELVVTDILAQTHTILDSKIFISVNSFNQMHDNKTSFPQFIWAKLKKPMLFFQLKKSLEPDLKVFSTKLNKKGFIRTFSPLLFIFKLILASVIILALMQIILFTSNKFTQLKKEVKILKNYGASDIFIILSIYFEFMILYTISFFLSLGCSYYHLKKYQYLYENLIIFPLSKIFFSVNYYILLYILPLLVMFFISVIFSKLIKNK